MSNNYSGFQLPALEEIIESSIQAISPETLVINAIARMNQPQSGLFCNLTAITEVFWSSYLPVLEQSQSYFPANANQNNAGRLAGILTEQDIVKLSAAEIDLKTVTVGEVMTKNIITLKQSDFQNIHQVISVLRQHLIKQLPIVDDLGELTAIVSLDGISRALNLSNFLKMRSVANAIDTEVLQAPPTASILSLSKLMVEQGQSCVVIVENKSSSKLKKSDHSCRLSEKYLDIGIPVGIVTQSDIVQLQILGLDLADTAAQTVMSTPLIKHTDTLLDIQQQMTKLWVNKLVVTDELGDLYGTIGFQDMLRVLNTALDEVIPTSKQQFSQDSNRFQQEQQRKKSELKLQPNQQLLELLVRSSPAAIAMVDRDMRYILASDRWIEDYQIKEKDIIGKSHYEIFPELPERWKQDHQDCLTGKVEVLKSESDSFVRPDGRVDWLRWELRPWRDSVGQIGGLVMFSEVITKQKLLQQKLQSSEAQMQAVFEAMTDLVLTIELASSSIKVLPTQFSDLNNAFVRSKIVQQIYPLIFNSSEAENYQSLIQKVLQTRQTINFEHSLKINDSTYWFSTNISAASETIVVWVSHNIARRKKMEQNSYAEKELAQVALKSIGEGVITTDTAGKVTFINPVAERLTGWSTAEAQDQLLTDIFYIVDHFTREPVPNPIDMVLQTNQTYKLESDTVLIAKDGTEHAIEDSTAPIQDRQGKLIGAVTVFRDVTESRSLAHKLDWQATHDALTGLYNRRKFEKLVKATIQESQYNEIHHVLCYLDLDRFKIVNDTCGHAAGDELLKQITTLLKQRIRATDIFARLGGDEFGLLLHQCPVERALIVANQLRQLVQDFRFVWSDNIFKIGVSIGVAPINSKTTSLANVLNAADSACYAAKEKGRNCIHLYHK